MREPLWIHVLRNFAIVDIWGFYSTRYILMNTHASIRSCFQRSEDVTDTPTKGILKICGLTCSIISLFQLNVCRFSACRRSPLCFVTSSACTERFWLIWTYVFAVEFPEDSRQLCKGKIEALLLSRRCPLYILNFWLLKTRDWYRLDKAGQHPF